MRKFKIAHQEKGKVIDVFCLVFAIKPRDFWRGLPYKISARHLLARDLLAPTTSEAKWKGNQLLL